MTDEMIKLYAKIQGKRGEWVVGDRLLTSGKEFIFLRDLTAFPRNANYPYQVFSIPSDYSMGMTEEELNVSVWLPKPIDGAPNGSEDERRRWGRCLMGMCRIPPTLFPIYNGATNKIVSYEVSWVDDDFHHTEITEGGATPQEALLRAIIAQEGL